MHVRVIATVFPANCEICWRRVPCGGVLTLCPRCILIGMASLSRRKSEGLMALRTAAPGEGDNGIGKDRVVQGCP